MTLLLKKARIIDPDKPLHGQTRDILVRHGQIAEVAVDIAAPAETVIDEPGLQVAPGFVETFADAGEPGTEFRETLDSAAAAAAAGGCTHLFVGPNTVPVRHNRPTVEAILQRTFPSPVRIHAIGAVTRDTLGKELAEMHDMRAAGAIAFSDGQAPIQQADILVKALQFVKAFDGIIIQLADDGSLAPHGLMHEGVISTQLGLLGRPALAETLTVSRAIRICAYTGSRLHLTGITLASSVEEIWQAQANGVDVTGAVTPHHLMFCDEDLSDYDTHLKVNPPLRSRAERDVLLQAVKAGQVDMVSAHHLPQHLDHKQCEFEYARPGIAGIQTLFPSLRQLGLEMDLIVRLLSQRPRRTFGLPDPGVLPGSPADLVLLLPDDSFTLTAGMVRSRSANNPLIGRPLKGQVFGTILGDRWETFQ